MVWYCPICLTELFPFNHIEEEDLFIAEINKIEICPEIINISDGMLFNPFEVNADRYCTPLYEIDPDIKYYNSTGFHLGTNCNCYYEDHFETALKTKRIDIKTRNTLSMCHLNIRSMIANLSSFEICLNNMNYNFSVIGLSEIWLRDHNCNLYNIEDYTFTEVHRTERAGGGVGIFVKDDIPFHVRTDICGTERAGGGVGIFVKDDIPFHVRTDMCGITDVYECVLWKLIKNIFTKKISWE